MSFINRWINKERMDGKTEEQITLGPVYKENF